MGEVEKLENLAEQINAAHRSFVGTLRKTVEHGIRAGELLAEAKAQCSHGTWLPWLEQNFEGAPRTAQEYMRLHNHRDEILAKTRDSAHLSVSGALKELAAPSEKSEAETDAPERNEQDIDVSLIRTLQGRFLRFWSDEEREAFERFLANPGQLEEALHEDLFLANMLSLAAQVAVDGFMLEKGEEPDGLPLISYRTPLGKPPEAKEKIVKVLIPATEAVKTNADLAECIKRGCWQFGLLELKAWRALHNWFAKALAAEQQTDMEVWEKRVAWNADWRQLDPPCKFLTERALHPETTKRQWVRENNLKPGEFHKALELAEWLVGDYAERLWVNLTEERSARGDRFERWKSFAVAAY